MTKGKKKKKKRQGKLASDRVALNCLSDNFLMATDPKKYIIETCSRKDELEEGGKKCTGKGFSKWVFIDLSTLQRGENTTINS